VPFNIQGCHLLVRNRFTRRIGRFDECRLDGQAGGSGGVTNPIQGQGKGRQRRTGPGGTDLTEQPVFDGVRLCAGELLMLPKKDYTHAVFALLQGVAL
jgi:hypothetical protein